MLSGVSAAAELNNAPVLDPSGIARFAMIGKDATDNTGQTVQSVIDSVWPLSMITDADAGALRGMAVTAANNSLGNWQFSIDAGAHWSDVGDVSESQALALRPEDRLRFVPDGANADTAAATFRAWDQTGATAGQQGTKVAVGTPGGTSPFSAATETASMTVAAFLPVYIPKDIIGAPGSVVTVPLRIAEANGLRSADITIHYDTNVLDATNASVKVIESTANPDLVWPASTSFAPNVNDATGTIIVSISNFPAIGAGGGSLMTIDFTIKSDAPVGTHTKIDLRSTLLNEGHFTYAPVSQNGDDSTDGEITINTGNHPPQGADNSLTVLEDHSHVFVAGAFGFSDPNDTPANMLLAVKITTLPTAGDLTDDGVAVTAGQFVSVTDIDAGKLVFTPATDANGNPYASFTFQVQDDGGTANGGSDIDPSPKTVTAKVTSVNDHPLGTDNAVTTLEDTAYAFAASDFGFSDPNDTPPNAFLAVKMATLPTAGNLTNNGVAVTAGQFVPTADISAGKLVFNPAPNANGAAYARFTFQVQDDGGVANGGSDTDPTARTMTINVTSANDAPQVTVPGSQNVDVNSDKVIWGISVQDVDAEAESIQMKLSIAHGKLTVSDSVGGGVPASGITGNGTQQVVLTGTVAQINATLADAQGLTYRGVQDYNGTDTLTVTADDQGHAGSGGAKTDTKTVAITVGQMGRLSGFVYADTNRNTRADANEGVPGVKITLTNSVTGEKQDAWTDDNGWYEFRNLPAGTYQIAERQPAALLDGGANSISGIQLGGSENKTGQLFRELGLRPEYIYNRLLATSTHPVGSDQWCAVIRKIIADAEKKAGNTVDSAPPVVTQQVLQQGDKVVVRGTNGNDNFEFIPGPTKHTVVLNGETHQFDATGINTVTFDGGLGKDTAILSGTAAKQQIELLPMSGRVQGVGYTVDVYGTEKINAIGGSGGDEATLRDSSADEALQAEKDFARLAAYYYANEVSKMTRVRGISDAGGRDTLKRNDPLDYVFETEGDWLPL